MPANRSRTERWRDCLQQIMDRGGGLEFSVKRPDESSTATDLVWRVRILSLTDKEIVVERPTAMGQAITLSQGVELIAVMSIGQNRWMFETTTLDASLAKPTGAGQLTPLRLAMPTNVERCRRRDFYRMSTAGLNLPTVRCWPLLDPLSVVAAEVANRALLCDLESGSKRDIEVGSATDVLPEVAPPFTARLVNIGGGGLGLLVDKSESSAVERSRLLWTRVDLLPEIPAPLGLTARIVHTHRDSEMNVYIGAAFDFSFHAAHRDFVVAQITRYVTMLQKRQRVAA